MVEAKVVHLTSVHKAFDVRIFAKECRSLARAGYDVTLVVPHERDEVVDGVVIKSVPRARGRVSRMTRTVWELYREALQQGADIYHFHDPELFPVGLRLRARGKKVIYDIHEDCPKDILSKYYLPRWALRSLSWAIEGFENFASRRFSTLVAATPAIAERFRGMNSRTELVQNFPIKEEMTAGCDIRWRDRPLDIVHAGGILAISAIRQMVEAMGLLPEGLATKLILAGEFSPPNLRQEVACLPGWSRVKTLGFISRSALAQLFGNVRAGLVLSLPEPNSMRSQPTKLFEYMSAAIPVIASDFPRWREIIEEGGCGLLVDPVNPKAIAETIEYILTHPQEAEAMGLRGREAVERKYNWSGEEKKLLQLYADLL